MPSHKVTAVIVAAGSSRRMGFDKLLATIGGKSVLQLSMEAIQCSPAIAHIVLVGSPTILEAAAPWLNTPALSKFGTLVAGGCERSESVINGLRAVPADTTHVAVHDAARPLVSQQDIQSTVDAALASGAATLAQPVPDTLKRVDVSTNLITTNVDRTGLWAMQTPQIARVDWLLPALENMLAAGQIATDEVTVLQAASHPVLAIANTSPNIKITWPSDLDLAAHILAAKASPLT